MRGLFIIDYPINSNDITNKQKNAPILFIPIETKTVHLAILPFRLLLHGYHPLHQPHVDP